jgi:hypothetical protein
VLATRRTKIIAGAVLVAALGGTPVAVAAVTSGSDSAGRGGAVEQARPTADTPRAATAPAPEDTNAAEASVVSGPSDGVQPMYGDDGKLVRDAQGNCVQGFAPGTAPQQNICFDPSLVPDPAQGPGVDVTWDVTVPK